MISKRRQLEGVSTRTSVLSRIEKAFWKQSHTPKHEHNYTGIRLSEVLQLADAVCLLGSFIFKNIFHQIDLLLYHYFLLQCLIC